GEVRPDRRLEARLPARWIAGRVVFVLALVRGLAGDEPERIGERRVDRGAPHAVDLRLAHGGLRWIVVVAAASRGGEERDDDQQAVHRDLVHGRLVLPEAEPAGRGLLTRESSSGRMRARTVGGAKRGRA